MYREQGHFQTSQSLSPRMPSSSSKELKIFAIFCEHNDQVIEEIKDLVWQQYYAVNKYELNLWQTAYDLEQLAFKYEALLKKHKNIQIAGSVAAVAGPVLTIAGGVTSIVLTGGTIAPILAAGLMATGTTAGIGGGVTKFGNDRTTQKREAELSQELARILTANAESHDTLKSSLLNALNQDRKSSVPNKIVVDTERCLEFLTQLKKMASKLSSMFPPLKQNLLDNVYDTIKHVGSSSSRFTETVSGGTPLTDNFVKGGSEPKVGRESLGKAASSKGSFVIGGTAIALGVFSLGYEIFQIVQDNKKPKSTIVQDLRLMAARLRMEMEY